MRAAFVPAALALASVMLSIPTIAHAEGGTPADAAPTSSPAPLEEVAEARRQIEATLAQMRAVSRRVRAELRVTRRRGTTRQITCVDEALSRSNAALRRGRDLGVAIRAAYGREDLEAARGGRRRLVELSAYQRQAATSGAACSPQRDGHVVTDATTVELWVDPRIVRVP